MTESEQRSYENPYDSTPQNEEILTSNGEINADFAETLQGVADAMLERLVSSFHVKDTDDYTVYTGTSGVAFLYLLLADKMENSEYNKKGLKIVKECLPRLKSKRVSFLNGDTGPLALGAVFYHRLKNEDESKKLIKRITEMSSSVSSKKSDMPDEVLFGRAGYLYSLLFVNKYIGENAIEPDVITKVVSVIMESGRSLAVSEKRKVPLMYMWNGEYYLGAAHGIAGIMYMLLQARQHISQSDLVKLIQPTINFLMTTRFSSGNFRATLESEDDRLVQWCHGAPAMVDMFVLAYEVFSDQKYLDIALECGEVVWKYGILKKSYSICHGVSGNGYTFLSLYNVTKDPTYLYQACKFAEWCTSYGKFQSRNPDRPLSLFEGIAGAIYFLFDILKPEEAVFPAYCL